MAIIVKVTNLKGSKISTFVKQYLLHNSVIRIMDESIYYKNYKHEMRVSDVNDLVQEKPTVLTTPLPLENRNLIKICPWTYSWVKSSIEKISPLTAHDVEWYISLRTNHV